MENSPTNSNVIIEETLLKFLNSWPEKPMEIRLDELSKRDSSMSLQPLSSAKKSKPYINGSYNGGFPFAIYVRAVAMDTKSKIDARKILNSLDKWMSEKDENKKYVNLPVLSGGDTAIKIEMTSTPSVAAMYENGTEDYQAIFLLTYKHKEEKVNA